MISLFPLSKRKKCIWYITILTVIIVILDRIVFSPIALRLKNLNGEISNSERKLKKSIDILSQKDLIIREYEKYINNLKQKGSDEEIIGALLSIVEKLAENSFISIVNINPLPVEDMRFCKEYAVKIEVEAKIEHIVDFIYRVEKLPQLLRIPELRLSSQKSDPSILKIYLIITEKLIS